MATAAKDMPKRRKARYSAKYCGERRRHKIKPSVTASASLARGTPVVSAGSPIKTEEVEVLGKTVPYFAEKLD